MSALWPRASPPEEEPDPLLKIVERPGSRRDVHYLRDGQWVNLTRFTGPHVIFHCRTSPDGRWAYVWHHKEYPPRRLSVYDLTTLQRTAHFVPGFGGVMQWTPAETILHCWANGPNLRAYRVYDPTGKIILEDVVSGLDVSPDGRYLVTFPSLFLVSMGPLEIRDLKDLRVVYSSRGNADVRCAWDLAWPGSDRLRVTYWDSDEKEHARTIELSGTSRGGKPG